jgi:hypothetical protein
MPRPELSDFGDELIGQCPRRWTARKTHRTDQSFGFRPKIVMWGFERIVLQHGAVIEFEQIERRNQNVALKVGVMGRAERAPKDEGDPQCARWRECRGVLAYEAYLRRCDPFLFQVVPECANGARAVGSDRG